MKFPKIGQTAPAIKLLNQDGELIQLSDYKGEWVLIYFYPKASTPGCTVQACHLRDSKAVLKKKKINVLGISPDAPKKLKKFQEKENLNFDLLSDEDHSIAEAYGCWGKKKFMGREYMGIIRTSFIIDPKGKLVQILENVNTKTHHEDALEVIASLDN